MRKSDIPIETIDVEIESEIAEVPPITPNMFVTHFTIVLIFSAAGLM